jgi:hypothetical protein
MDHHVPRAITAELDDSAFLDRATDLGRALFSQDDDLLEEAARRQGNGIMFGGVIYAHQLHVAVGVCVNDLELIAIASEPDDLLHQMIFLPL